jgi:hypothetical protein
METAVPYFTVQRGRARTARGRRSSERPSGGLGTGTEERAVRHVGECFPVSPGTNDRRQQTRLRPHAERPAIHGALADVISTRPPSRGAGPDALSVRPLIDITLSCVQLFVRGRQYKGLRNGGVTPWRSKAGRGAIGAGSS